MREGSFIKKNRERWEEIQHATDTTPDEKAADFTRLIDDLSYARTFYPKGRVTTYLNKLAGRIYLQIYQNRKDPANRIAKFFSYDVPVTIYRHRKIMLLSLIVFIVFFSVGFFSAIHEPGFVREIMGDDYVDKTEKNIREGNPFDIYASMGSFYMWVMIMVNNISVALTYFFRGLLLGIPSMIALAKNAVMVGAFEYMFYSKGLGGKAVVTILLHGILELSAIIFACGAGTVMGISWLFPGSRSRLHAFREGVKDGVKIIVSMLPIFVIAAFIEGYITRHYKMPLFMSLSLLFISATFILWYFVIYPYRLHRAILSQND